MNYLQFFLIAAIFLLFIFIRRSLRRSSRNKGYWGERKVNKKIESLIKRNRECRSFYDVILPTPDGTTQIDHILISPYGIFVIETKNLTGWIFGSEDQRTWTQILYRKKYKFQNPLRQNYKHIKAVQKSLNVNLKKIHSVVVFVGNSVFKTAMPYNVLVLRNFLPYLRSYNQEILSSENIDKYTQILRTIIHSDPTTSSDHIMNVKQNKSNPTCPRCGKSMVLRTARNGRREGSQFWGCSGFPSCRATKNVN